MVLVATSDLNCDHRKTSNNFKHETTSTQGFDLKYLGYSRLLYRRIVEIFRLQCSNYADTNPATVAPEHSNPIIHICFRCVDVNAHLLHVSQTTAESFINYQGPNMSVDNLTMELNCFARWVESDVAPIRSLWRSFRAAINFSASAASCVDAHKSATSRH